jgi:hypothetical protein
MRELLGGKGTISLLDCSAENAPNTNLYLLMYPLSFCKDLEDIVVVVVVVTVVIKQQKITLMSTAHIIRTALW